MKKHNKKHNKKLKLIKKNKIINQKIIKFKNLNYQIISAPKHLSLIENNRNTFIKWINKIITITNENKKICINFQTSQKAEASGMLLMIANLYNIRKIKGYKTIKIIPPKKNILKQVFCQIGLFKMFNIKSKININSKDVIYWNYINGKRVDTSKAGSLILKIFDKYKLNTTIRRLLYNGISEAITNAIIHAYPDTLSNDLQNNTDLPNNSKISHTSFIAKKYKNQPSLSCKLKPNWWMFCGIKDGNLTVLICDIGIGIPRSLIKTNPDTFWNSMEEIYSDAIYDNKSTNYHSIKLNFQQIQYFPLVLKNLEASLTIINKSKEAQKTLKIFNHPNENLIISPQSINKLIQNLNIEGYLIKSAMQISRSKTKLPHRGLGMAELKYFIDAINSGKLNILSHNGLYQYDGLTKKETTKTFPNTINGTIIAWNIPVESIPTLFKSI